MNMKKTKVGKRPYTKKPQTKSRFNSLDRKRSSTKRSDKNSTSSDGRSRNRSSFQSKRNTDTTRGTNGRRDYKRDENRSDSRASSTGYKRDDNRGAGRRSEGDYKRRGTTSGRGERKNNYKSNYGDNTGSRGGFSRGRSGGGSRGGGRGGNRGGGRGGRGGGRKMPTFDPTEFIKKTPQKAELEEKYVTKNTFKTFGLDSTLVKTIGILKMTIPTPIQDQIIPHILKNKDVIALAETGTGKTAAFLIPLIEKTTKNMEHRTLILVPTRELAVQVTREIFLLTKNLGIHSVMCVGGMDIRPQIKKLSRPHQFVIATPGRALDLIKKRHILAEKFKTVVLDEADRMLDMGFITDMRKILEKTPENRETLLFSATMNQASEKLADDFLKNPITVSVKKRDVTTNIEQSVVHYQQNNKFDTLLGLLNNKEFKKVLIFGSMKHSAQKLAEQLNDNKVSSESIHGNKSHSHRQRALQNFKDGTHKVIVATDVVARGIHVDGVTHVINYDLPNTADDYIHRIGRTGRAGQKGKAITFIQSRG